MNTDYDEPWRNEIGDFEIYSKSKHDPIAYADSDRFRNRIIACVNACAGMEDPEKEINDLKNQVKHWKSNHDNQVKIKSILIQRPDLRDRANRIQKLIEDNKSINSLLNDINKIIM